MDLDSSVSTEQMGLLQITTRLTLGAVSLNKFDSVTPIVTAFLAVQGEGDAVDYGVVGAEGDAVDQLLRMLNTLQKETEVAL